VKKWIFWAGIGFLVGGIVSFGINATVEGTLTFEEDISGYALGWIAVGIILISYGLISKNGKL